MRALRADDGPVPFLSRRGVPGRLPPETSVGVLMALAAFWAVWGSAWLFPHLSINRDEAVYRLQADALAHGHLFPVAPPAHRSAFLPWLSAYRDGHFVPKYAPVHAAVLAAGRLLTGTDRASLGLIAAAAVLVTYAVARQLTGRHRTALVASGLLVISPLFFVQSATYLSYTDSYTLLGATAATLLAALRSGRRGWYVAAGGLAGVAFFARPFDLVLFAAPLAAGALVALWPRPVRPFLWMAAGAAGPLMLCVWFNRQATGSWTRSPFGLLDASDTIGFGAHRMYPTDPYVHFTPALGFVGLVRNLAFAGFWFGGGLVLLGLALWALWRTPVDRRRTWWPVAGAGLAIPVGYLFFWGSYGSVIFGLPRYLGPFYYMPLLLPAVVFGAVGLERLWRWDRGVALLAVVGMVGVCVFVGERTVRSNLRLKADAARLYSGLERPPAGRTVVFLPPLGAPYLLFGFATAMNHYGYQGPIVYAVDQGAAADRAVAAFFPHRRAYRLVVHGTYGQDPPDPHLRSALVRLTG